MTRRLVVEADGGSRGNPGPAGYGAVVRDAATGEVLVETAEAIGRATNNVAEYRGLGAGLRAAHALDPAARVEVRMDSKLIVEQMSGRWQVKDAALRELAKQAHTAHPPELVSYAWIPREQNRHADRLANEAMDAARAGRPWEPTGTGSSLEVPTLEAPANALVGWADLGAPTVSVLVRHGETAHTAEKRFSGAGGADPGLSAVGLAQAEAAAAALAARGDVTAVVASPLRRTRETAEVVAQALGVPLEVEDDLREAAFGDWDGLTFAEVTEGWPQQVHAWLGSTAVAPPGGESLDEVATRVQRARVRVLAAHPGETVAVVSHVTPIKLWVRAALDAPMRSLFRMELAPASISEIAWYPDGNASVQGFADVCHLAGAASASGS